MNAHNAAAAPAMSEAQRFERLRAQDGKPLVPPPAMHGLLGKGGLDPAKAQQAVQMWQAAQAELGTVHSFPGEERLFWCFFLLASLYSGQGNRAGGLQLAQQTLPLLRDVRHQQVTHGVIARYAALTGDQATAHASLSQLHANSDDLQVDTCYRFSNAYVAALRGDDNGVLQALGYNSTDVPISDAYDQVCAALRANAHERQGRLDVAKQQLTAIASTPAGLASLQEIVQKNHELAMLQTTLPQLQQYAQHIAANVVQTKSGISLGGIFLLPIIGIVLFGGGSALLSFLPTAMQGIAITGATIAFIAVSFIFARKLLFKSAGVRKQLATSGVDAIAKIVGIETTGTRVNHQPMFRFRMLVEIPGQQPYLAVHNEVLAPGRVQQLPPGTQLRVKVDPNDRATMAIMWG
ncbi:MAG: hypothetical protein AAF721_00980 [Myxococcota bacterium]